MHMTCKAQIALVVRRCNEKKEKSRKSTQSKESKETYSYCKWSMDFIYSYKEKSKESLGGSSLLRDKLMLLKYL